MHRPGDHGHSLCTPCTRTAQVINGLVLAGGEDGDFGSAVGRGDARRDDAYSDFGEVRFP